MNYFTEANKYYNEKNYTKAIELYESAIDNNENIACSYYNSGVCFIKLKNFDKAIEMIKTALKKSPLPTFCQCQPLQASPNFIIATNYSFP